MTLLLNLVWFLLGGFISGIAWALLGVLWCITVVGIPIGKQCFKFAALSFAPFGKQIVSMGGSGGNLILNLLWIAFGGLEMAIALATLGCVFCITIIGIPFGKQYFKFAKLALMPFGARIY